MPEISGVTIDTTTITGQRAIHFDSVDQIINDAEACAATEHRTLGNWTLGQICAHLALPMNYCIDDFPFSLPWPMRWVEALFRNRVLKRGFTLAFKLRGKSVVLLPPDISTEDGLNHLRRAIERLRAHVVRRASSAFGKLTREQWDQLHCWHAELYLSFVVR